MTEKHTFRAVVENLGDGTVVSLRFCYNGFKRKAGSDEVYCRI